eukprot:TCALIF_13134-PA protein Name:"Protein of unknown function" AED:0.14 eAED:0.65 QI:73/0/0/1/0/0/2/0/113
MCCWAKDMPLKNCSKEVDGLSPNTEWQISAETFALNGFLPIQELLACFAMTGMETLFLQLSQLMSPIYVFHRKYHRGRYTPGAWIFGGIQRETGDSFFGRGPKPEKKNSGSFD